MKNAKRLLAYDIIRVIALLMIVMVHVSAYIVIFFPDTDGVEWLVGNIFNGISRAGVPMFIMLSGALLLNEDKAVDPKRFYRKNLLTMVLLAAGWLVAYGLFYAFVLPLLEGGTASLSVFWGYLVSFRSSEYPHLWYMVMVVGMYLMIPVLRLFVKRENKNYIIGIIVACTVFQFAARTGDVLTLNSATSVSGFLAGFHLEPLSGFMGYLLLGWYFNEYSVNEKIRRLLYGAGILSVVFSTLAVDRMIDTVPGIRDYFYSELSLPAMLYGAALFVFISSVCKGRYTQNRFLAVMSDCSFGVYLVHVIILEIFVRKILPYEQFGLGSPFVYIVLLFAVTLSVSFAIVKGADRLGGVRRIFFNR